MCFNALYCTLLGDLNQTSLSSLQLLRGNFPGPPQFGNVWKQAHYTTLAAMYP